MEGRLLESARKGHGRAGQRDLINHLTGKRLISPYKRKSKPLIARASDLAV